MERNKRKSRKPKRVSNKLPSRGIAEKLWKARIISINEFEFCSSTADMGITKGNYVIMPARYGMELARISGPTSNLDSIEAASIRRIIRIATKSDFSKRGHLERLEESAFEICREKIFELKLEMKLLCSHYTFDERKILFYFTAKDRIDFRELVKALVTQFRKRIELRQVGSRDETRMIGGVAVCGRLYCCHSITDQLAVVYTKMAKDQRAFGPCSRLLCCLSYELGDYASEKRLLPRKGVKIAYKESMYEVTEVNKLSRTIQLTTSNGLRIYTSASSISRRPEGGWEIRSDKMNKSIVESEGT